MDWRKGVDLDDYSYEIQSNYFFEKLLTGSAIYGTVALAHEVHTFEKFAVKSIELYRNEDFASESVSFRDTTNAQNEIDIMLQLNHPNILKLVKTFWNQRYAHLFTEFMDVGDLLHYVIGLPLGRMNEPDTKFAIFQVSQGLKYLHDNKIGHGDIKPDNIFIKSRSGNLIFKIGDFGLSILDESAVKKNATLQYAAPEIFQKGNPVISIRKTDIWSLGISVYACISGHSPFGLDQHQSVIIR